MVMIESGYDMWIECKASKQDTMHAWENVGSVGDRDSRKIYKFPSKTTLWVCFMYKREILDCKWKLTRLRGTKERL